MANFVDGRQIDGINPRIQVLPEDKAEKLGRRNGAAHFLGNEIKECRSRFNPVVWKGYEKEGLGAIVEYFDIQVNQHSKHNSVIKNLFVEPFERGTWLPLLAVVITAGALITFFLPAILLAVTKLFSRLLFRKEGKARENTSAVMAGSGKRGDVNETFKGLKDIDVRIRQRLMVIIPTLNSIGPFMEYLAGLYVESGFLLEDDTQKKRAVKREKELMLLRKFYPQPRWDGVDGSNTYPKRTDAMWIGYGNTHKLRPTEIEELIIEPVAYIFLSAVGYDSERLNNWTKGGEAWEKLGGNPFLDEKIRTYF